MAGRLWQEGVNYTSYLSCEHTEAMPLSSPQLGWCTRRKWPCQGF